MNMLTHLIYASTSPREFDRQELLILLKKARATNAMLDITGMLLYENKNFFQVLEGSESAVMQLFEEICADKRHQAIVRIIQEPIAKRSFCDWTMSFSNVSREELCNIEGLNDFFEGNSVFLQLDGGRAKKLLAAFQRGRWRHKLAPHPTMALEHVP
ncbi:BLUF domain-containing protein [Janthinobacterium sp. 75]|uniref:BLUF domain-containing protein n=1 Tax=Janthinobacterium sp. 75 TaxID=2135628 RepID=UPI001062D35E|nr:BLUF domain-containing protein [Janthinobacterium sp. 75]TDY35182.1 FAD-dependent sensor of blue light [Janthinobacterium sp. 75]